MFLILIKFNRNIWSTFYSNKIVTAFASLYVKIHSLIMFFFTPTLNRQNAVINIKKYEPTIQNYLQLAKHLTDLFVQKAKYESAFN